MGIYMCVKLLGTINWSGLSGIILTISWDQRSHLWDGKNTQKSKDVPSQR